MHRIFPHGWVQKVFEFLFFIIAVYLLTTRGLGPMGVEHLTWEAAVLLASALLYVPIFIFWLIRTPPAMEREQISQHSTIVQASKEREASLLEQIKKPRTNEEDFEDVRTKFDGLALWAQQLLECVFVIGHTPENATSYRSHGTSGPEIEVPRPNPLAELNKATGGWLIREKDGAGYSIKPNVRRHCPKLWGGRT
jgi:hypothetical protein